MPSPAERARLGAEVALRAIALAGLLWSAWAALTPVPPGARVVEASGGDVPSRLARWAADPPDRLELTLEAAPASADADLLAGLRRSGTRLDWRDGGVPGLAVEIVPRGDPAGGAAALVAAPDSATVALRDAVGPLDTVAAAGAGATLGLPAAPAGVVVARVGAQEAAAAPRDSLVPRPVLVLGRAGWESRFVVRALEERGWTVHARLAVAPGLDVRLGAPAAPDTARYGAVILLDGAAGATTSRLAEYVRSGGGLVLGPQAAADPAFRPLAAGAVADEAAVPVLAAVVSGPADLALRPITELGGDALPLERRGEAVAVAARRLGAGRVVQIGYPETWRWRMAGPEGAPAAHRAWWSEIVAGVAYRASSPLPPDHAADPAPRARLHDRLGDPANPATERDGPPRGIPRPPRWIAALVLAALALEWGSRRTRGAR